LGLDVDRELCLWVLSAGAAQEAQKLALVERLAWCEPEGAEAVAVDRLLERPHGALGPAQLLPGPTDDLAGALERVCRHEQRLRR
jgi:hypothetical protein